MGMSMNKPLTPLPILLERLHAAGYLESDELVPNRLEPPSSLWIGALQMIGGWLAALFLLVAVGVGLSSITNNAPGRIMLGVLLGVTTVFYLQRAARAAFLRQFALALHLTGQALFMWGCISPDSLGNSALVLGALAEFTLLRFAASRSIAILAGLCALYLARLALLKLGFDHAFSVMIYTSFAFYLFAGLLWWREKDWLSKSYGESVYALAWAFSLTSLATVLGFFMPINSYLFYGLFAHDAAYATNLQTVQFLFCASSVVFAFLLALPWLKNPYYSAALLLSLAVLVLTWRAPALGVGALFLVFGFRRAHGLLSLLGGLLFVLGVSRFYYDLQLSLLAKSVLMVFGGALLLAIRELFLYASKDAK